MTWMGRWRGERFVVTSPLSMDDARARLNDGLVGRKGTFGASFGPSGVVRGSVRHDTVKLVAMHAGLGITSPTVLRGRLAATGTGSQLDYRLGWSLPLRVFGAFFLGIVMLGFFVSAVAAVCRLVMGHVEAAGGPAAVAGVTVAIMLLFLGLATAARWLSCDQVTLLHSWLAERLQPRV